MWGYLIKMTPHHSKNLIYNCKINIFWLEGDILTQQAAVYFRLAAAQIKNFLAFFSISI